MAFTLQLIKNAPCLMACLLIFTIVDSSTALTFGNEELDMGTFAHPGLTDENTLLDLIKPALAKTGTPSSTLGASCKATGSCEATGLSAYKATGVQGYKATGVQVHEATGVQRSCSSSAKINKVQVASSTESESTTDVEVEVEDEVEDATAAEATKSSKNQLPKGISLQLLFKGLTTEMVTAKAATLYSRMTMPRVWTAEAENGDTIVSAHVVYMPGADAFKSERSSVMEEVARHFDVNPENMRVNQAEFIGVKQIPAEEAVLHLGEFLNICWDF